MHRGNARIRVARPIVGFRPELLSLEGREMPGETLGLSGLAWLPAGSVLAETLNWLCDDSPTHDVALTTATLPESSSVLLDTTSPFEPPTSTVAATEPPVSRAAVHRPPAVDDTGTWFVQSAVGTQDADAGSPFDWTPPVRHTQALGLRSDGAPMDPHQDPVSPGAVLGGGITLEPAAPRLPSGASGDGSGEDSWLGGGFGAGGPGLGGGGIGLLPGDHGPDGGGPGDGGGGPLPGNGGGLNSLLGGNHPPVAVDDGYFGTLNQPLVVTVPGVIANDYDPEEDPLTAILHTYPQYGTLDAFNPDGSFTYTPNTGFVGTDAFTYWVNDGEFDSNIATVTLTIQNPNTVQLTASMATAVEVGQVPGEFTFTRTGPLTLAVPVKYTLSGTAENGKDVESLSGLVVIPAGEASATVSVVPTRDPWAEGTEALTVTLVADPVWYTVGTNDAATVAIIDDPTNHAPVVTVAAVTASGLESSIGQGFIFSRTGSTLGDLNVSYAVGGSATPGVDYVGLSGMVAIPDGQASVLVPITLLDDPWAEGDETIQVRVETSGAYDTPAVEPVTFTIQDEATDLSAIVTVNAAAVPVSEGGGSQEAFTIVRTGSTANALMVMYQVSGTATNGIDYQFLPGMVTIPPGAVSVAVPVTLLQDSLFEGLETITLTVVPDWLATYGVGTANTQTILVRDDDVQVGLAVETIQALPDDPTRLFLEVRRTGDLSQDVAVSYSVGGSAVPGVDYSALPGTVLIAAGQATATIPVTTLPGLVGSPTLIVTLTSGPGYSIDPMFGSIFHLLTPPVVPPATGLPKVAVYVTDGLAHETGQDPGTFIVRRYAADLSQPLVVRVKINTDLIFGTHYVFGELPPGTVVNLPYLEITIPPGEYDSPPIDVIPVDDVLPDPEPPPGGGGDPGPPGGGSPPGDPGPPGGGDPPGNPGPPGGWTPGPPFCIDLDPDPGYDPLPQPGPGIGVIIIGGNDPGDPDPPDPGPPAPGFSLHVTPVLAGAAAGAGAVGGFAAGVATAVPVDVNAGGECACAAALDGGVVYSTATAVAQPTLQAHFNLDARLALPPTLKMQVTWNGVTQPQKTLSTAGLTNQTMLTMADVVATPVTQTGRYRWSITGSVGNQNRTVSGHSFVVVRQASPYGQGWSPAFLDQLVNIPADGNLPAGKLYVPGGAVNGHFFAAVAGGFKPESPAERGSLFANPNGTFTYRDTVGVTRTFDAQGRQIAWTSADQSKTAAYEYDTQGRLTVMRTFDGVTAAFTYANGYLARITTTFVPPQTPGQPGILKPATRSYEFTNVGGRVTRIVTPGGASYDYTYDAAGRLVAEQFTENGGIVRTGYVYTAAGHLEKILPGNVSNQAILVTPVARQGMNAIHAGKTFGSQTDAAGRTTKTEYYPEGFHHETTAPDGGKWKTERDGHYAIRRTTDPSGSVTDYKRDSQGFVTELKTAAGGIQKFEYVDINNRHLLKKHTDELNQATEYEYDAKGRITKRSTNGGKFEETWTWTAGGDLSHHNTPSRKEFYVLDGYGRIVEVWALDDDYFRPVTTLAYDSFGKVVTVWLGDRTSLRRTDFTYDAADRLIRQTQDPDGPGPQAPIVYQWGYAGGRLAWQLDPQFGTTPAVQKQTTWEYDSRGLVTKITEADKGHAGRQVTFAYNAAGDLLSVTNGRGFTTTLGYDAAGRVNRVTHPPVNGVSHFVTATYDKKGQITSTTDELGYSTNFTWSAMGWLTKITEGTSPTKTTTFQYDLNGQLRRATDPKGHATEYVYTPLGSLAKVTLPDHRIVTYGRDPKSDQLLSVTNERGYTTNFTWMSGERLRWVKDALGYRTWYASDYLTGQPLVTRNALNQSTVYQYDAAERLTGVTLPGGRTWQYAYAPTGNVALVTDPLGNVSRTDYDVFGRATTLTDAKRGITRLEFDANDNLTKVTDPVLNVTRYAYDPRDRLSTETITLGGIDKTRQYGYDGASRLTSYLDRNGRETTYQWDQFSRLWKENWKQGGATVRTIEHQYDLNDNLTKVWDVDATLNFSYDNRDRLTLAQNAGSPSGQPYAEFAYAYGLDSVTTQVKGTGGALFHQNVASYDALDRLQTLTQSGGTAQSKRVDLTYNAVGQYQSIVRSVSSPSVPVATTTFTYEATTGRLSGMNHTGPSGNLIRSYGYQYDLADRLTNISDTFAGPSGFGYDITNQVVSATHTNQPGESYTYDLNGNRQNLGYTTGQYNRITNDGVYSYEYDAEGNRTKRTVVSTGEYEEYTWDHRNRLTQVVKKSAGGAILNTVTEGYDPLDRRIQEESSSWGFTNTTWFAYDGEYIALRFNEVGSLTGRYLHGEAVDQIFAEEVGGQTRWTLTDHLGSVRDVVSDTGVTLGRITYDSFGQVTNTTGIVDTLFRYTARPGLASTGLYDYRARVYDPRIGQFLAEDPIAFTAGDPNLRRYVGNEPTRYTDPSGNARQPLFYLEIDPATRRVRKVYGRRPSLRESMNAAMAEPDAEAPADPIYVGGQPVTPPLSMQIRRAGGVGPYLCAEAGKPGVLDNVQRGLQAIGMVDQGIFGAIADLVNAGIDLLRGDVAGAGLGVLAAFPLVGNFFGGANSARKAADGLQDAAAVADKARDAQKAAAAAAETKKCVASSSGPATSPRRIVVDPERFPESARHLEESGATGRPLTVNRPGAAQNRANALRGRSKVPGHDLDETPPAVLRQPGDPVSVRPVPSGDNRGAGASIGNQMRGVPNGGQVIIEVPRPGG